MSDSSDLALTVIHLTHAPASSELSIDALLAESRRHHLAYREATRQRQDAEAQAALTAAANARAQAELADPDHTDPAWQTEGGTHARGMAAHEALHPDLLRFYLDWLTRHG
jgi:hypothetical protein